MAAELNNPLFDDEREFLERKKQEYERALRGDVDHIKEQGVQVGKVAAAGAGLVGIIWLISKAFGDNKRKAKKQHDRFSAAQAGGRDAFYADADEQFELNDEAFAPGRSAEFRGRPEQRPADDDDFGGHSARESAEAFVAQARQNRIIDGDENDELRRSAEAYSRRRRNDWDDDDDDESNNGFGSHFEDATPSARPRQAATDDFPAGRLDFGPSVHLHKQRQGQQEAGASAAAGVSALAYDDSRRLPASAEFPAGQPSRFQVLEARKEAGAQKNKNGQPSFGQQASQLLKSFLETSTGKAVAAQVSALALAYVTKLINDKLPAGTLGKNADLADAPATTSFYPSAAAPAASSASTPAVGLTFTDAPTEHPTIK